MRQFELVGPPVEGAFSTEMLAWSGLAAPDPWSAPNDRKIAQSSASAPLTRRRPFLGRVPAKGCMGILCTAAAMKHDRVRAAIELTVTKG
ncbi:hypothetical protein SLNSH_23895 [Alsobacter soli]|uniref:Uncharacterized protein n=1 Tax=Alsobacter soli TaxID=2109933 RepID=A0A2T1HLD7_9HYPH|nr:hypothetical protein SLNSH_23895 [Alsobacter soli]